MPYFFIFPIYVLLFVGLMIASLALYFIKGLRPWSSYLAFGTLGTLPGFILGNVTFWLITLGFLKILQMPMQQVTSDIAKGAATIVVVIFFVGGLAIANIGGCIAGFLGGIWLRSKIGRKKEA